MIHYVTEQQEDRLWLAEQDYDPPFECKTESVFAQCNGYMGVRAAHPFSVIGEKRGMFLAGVFNKAYENEVTELVNCPDITWFGLEIEGESVYPDRTELLSCVRKLDVRSGEFLAQYRFRLRSGRIVKVENRRFASSADVHFFAQEFKVWFEDERPGEIRIKTGINGQITNSGVSHFHRMDCRVYDRRQMEMRGELADQTLFMLTECKAERGSIKARDFGLDRRAIYETLTLESDGQGAAAVEKISWIGQPEENREPGKRRDLLSQAVSEGYEKLFERHQRIMQDYWERSQISIDGISEEEEAAICFAQYQIYGMTPWHTSACSIAAKGLTGEGYKGHVFWDTELFILPSLLYTFPKAARNLLKFRYRGLLGAQEKARQYGYEGAMFPWEAAVTGKEETPLYAALNIYTGKANKVWSGIKEFHVTADIVYALDQYFEATKDRTFMEQYGYEIAFEVARFWASCARWNKEHTKYGIYDIIGPDEYTEHVDNNAYTNYMAAYCVRTAKRYAEDIRDKKKELFFRLDRELELEKQMDVWERFLNKIYLPVPGEDGILPQDDTFLGKPCLENIEKYKKCQVKQSVLLDHSREEVVNMQVLKQADVVMLLNLFPHMIPAEEVRKNVLFYESRTIHDSSLSYCAHAQACAAIGAMDLAEDFFAKSLVIDLDDNPMDSRDGIHAASLGGVWNCLIFGFAGIHYEQDVLYMNPHLPRKWKSMEFTLMIAGRKLRVCVTPEEALLQGMDGQTRGIRVAAGGKEYLLEGELKIRF